MANQTQDVELRIRATNYSKKTTTEVADALKELAKAQEEQRKAAERGEATVADLEKSYGRMESAIKALLSQQALIKFYEAQSQKLAEVEARLAAARKAQDDYVRGLDPAAKRTKAQTTELAKLAREVKSAEGALTRISDSIGTTTGRMEKYGISTSNVADKQREIVQAVGAANSALAAQEAAIDNADASARSRREAQQRTEQREAQVRAEVLFNRAVTEAAAAQRREAAAARESAEAARMRDVQHEADMEALFTREANKRTEALNRQAAAIARAADAAERQMRASAGDGRAAPVGTPNLRAQLSGIADPNGAALQTVTGLTSAMDRLQERVAALAGPVRDYRGAVQEATAAQRALQAIAGNVDTYNRQIAAVRAARAEYASARTVVAGLVAELRSGSAGDDIASRLRAGQNDLDRAAASLATLTSRARETRTALRDAGIDTRNLAAAEQELVQQATRGAGAMNQLTEQVRRYGQANDAANDGQRTTLSFMQRLRGEVLSLVAAYVGLQATIGLGQKTLEAFNSTQAIQSRLLVGTEGDVKKAGAEFAYLRKTADDIGVSFTKTAPAYAKFALAAKTAGATTQETRFIFENFARTAATLGLSADDAGRMFKAIEQIYNKGKVQAEELTQQLGDVLPGAFQVFAKARGVTVEEFGKLMEEGKVGSDILVAVARQLGDTYAIAGNSAGRLSAAQARFDNAVNSFLNSVANGGFVEAYQGLLNRLTTFLNDGSADKLGRAIATGFTVAIDAIQLFVDNLEELKVLIGVILAMKFLSFLTTLPVLFGAMIAPLTAWNAQMLALNAQLGAFTAASAIAGTSATGFAALMGRLAPAIMAVGSALLFVARALPVIGAGIAAYAATSAILDKLDDNVRQRVSKSIKDTTKAVSDAERASAALAKARGTEREKAAQTEYDRLREIAVKAIKEQDKAVQAAKEKGVDLSSVATGLPRQASGGTADPGDLHGDANALKLLKAELAKEDKKLEEALKNQRLKSAKEELAERLKIVDEEYQARRDNAKATIKDAETLKTALAEIDKRANQAAAVERAKFNNEQAKTAKAHGDRLVKLQAEIKDKLAAIEDDIGKRSAELNGSTEPFDKRMQARVDAVGHAYDDLFKKIRDVAMQGPGGKSAAADAEKLLKTFVQQRQELERQEAARDEANRLVGEMNKLIAIQKSQLDLINAQEELGTKSAQDAADARAEVFRRSAPEIEAAGKRAIEFAESVRQLLDPVRYSEIINGVGASLAKQNGDAQAVANYVLSTQKQLNALVQQEADARAAVQQLRAAGAISSEQEVAALNAITLQYGTSIQTLAEQLLNFVKIARESGGMTKTELDQIEAGANRILTGVQTAKAAVSDLDKTFVNSVVNNGTNALDAMAQSLAKVALGQDSLADGFKNAGKAAAQFFAQLLKDIAMAIIRTQILKALQAFGGGIGAGATAVLGTAQHGGGVTGLSSSFARKYDPAIFATAERYHTGGLAGLKPNEVPAVLEKNEEVLTRDDPRHVLNGGGQSADAGVRVVLVDDRSRVPQAMASAEGEKVTVQNIRANIPTIKSMLGIR